MERPIHGVVMNIGTSLPVWFMWPDGTNGKWLDCYADPDKIRLLNGFLWLMKIADQANVTCYIEVIPERKLLESGTMIHVCYYRLHIPLTQPAVRAVILAMAMALAAADELDSTQPRKRQRTSSRSERPEGPAADAPGFKMISTSIGAEHISNWAQFRGWFTTATGRVPNMGSSREIVFDLPPANAFDDGALSSTPGADDDMASGADFEAWLEALPSNHVLNMTNMAHHFVTGMGRIRARLHPHQLDADNYLDSGSFMFPEFCNTHELVTRIEPNAPWLEGDVNNLVFAPFAHNAATLTMLPEELFRKMASMAAITGVPLPPSYKYKTLTELRDIFQQEYGDSAVTNYSPIVMLNPAERQKGGEYDDESVKILAEIYPAQGLLTDSMATQFRRLRVAKHGNVVTVEDVGGWIRESIQRIDQLYSDSAKKGFVPAYFRICAEASGVKHLMQAKHPDNVVRQANGHLARQFDGMDAANSMYAVQATLIRGDLHMTPAQASPLQFIYAGTLTALIPIINVAQPTIALMGQSDTGKSALMELLQLLILASAVVRRDTNSPLAMTCNSELGVQTTDELKTGVDTQDAHAATSWLTAWSTGLHLHERLQLATRPGEHTHNVITKSDRRRFLLTATNHQPHKNFASRMLQYYMPGDQIDGDVSRQELSTLSDSSTAYLSAKLVFRYVWAEHEAFWRIYQHMRFYICTSWYSVWHSLANKVMGKKHRPTTRHVRAVKRFGYGYMMTRLIAQYRQTDRSESFPVYAMANAVVTLSDYMQCYTQQQKTADKQHERHIVLRALLDNIGIDEPPGGKCILEVYDREYYATKLSTVAEIAGRTTELKTATGIVKDVMADLEAGSDGSEPKVVRMKGSGKAGRFAIHKSAVSVGAAKSVLTHSMATIIEFFKKDVIGKPRQAGDPKVWYISNDERYVIMKRAVKMRLLQPHLADYDSDVLEKAYLPETDLLRGMLLLEAAGALEYVDHSAMHPYVLNGEGVVLTQHDINASKPVDRGGVLDEMRMLGEVYISETPDNEITQEWVAEHAASVGATKEPRRRMYKSPLRLVDVIKLNIDVVRKELDMVLRCKLGMPALETNDVDTTQSAIESMWDACAAISGEHDAGSVIYMGIPSKKTTPFETHTIKPWHTDHIDLLNARRQTHPNTDDLVTDLDDYLLPGKQNIVRFNVGERKTEELCRRTAEINMVPFGLLPAKDEDTVELID